jgi:murein DD-endopeptidase MepM/ murein hydrolase activator NlpD
MRFRSRPNRAARLVTVARLAAIGLVIALGCAIAVRPASAQQPTADQFRSTAQKLVDAANAANEQGALDLFSPIMKKGLMDQKLGGVLTGLTGQYGKLTQVGTPVVTGSTARVPVTTERGALTFTMTLDNEGKISGLYVTPAAPSAPVPERNTVPLRLPVNGEWYVYWGGASEAENFHVRTVSQQRATDLVMTDAQGQTHKGFGLANADYYSFGQNVMAPADGSIVTVVSGVPDNTPGIPNPYNALGNMIIEKVSDNTYAVFGHLQAGSITVKPGDTVRTGQVIAKVGNSGNVTEPFLHFHLQNTPTQQEATGFSPYFTGVKVVRGTQTTTPAEYTPTRGDRISPATPGAPTTPTTPATGGAGS